MSKKASKRNYKTLRFIGIIPLIMLLLFIELPNIKRAGVYTDKPWLSEAAEIAVSDDAVYVLDGSYNYINKYDLSGEFCFTIKFRDTGSSRIFVDEKNNLCRYSVRGKRVEVYSDEGELSEKFDIDKSELIEQGKLTLSSKTKAEVDGVMYILKNHFIIDSKLLIDDSGEIVLESASYHICAIVYVLIFISLLAFAGYCNVICIMEKYSKKYRPTTDENQKA